MTFATTWACFLPSVGKSKTVIHIGDVGDEGFLNSAIRDPGIPKYSSTEKANKPNVSTRVTFAYDVVSPGW